MYQTYKKLPNIYDQTDTVVMTDSRKGVLHEAGRKHQNITWAEPTSSTVEGG